MTMIKTKFGFFVPSRIKGGNFRNS